MTLTTTNRLLAALLLMSCCLTTDSFQVAPGFAVLGIRDSDGSRSYPNSFTALRSSSTPDFDSDDGDELSLQEFQVGTLPRNPFLPLLSNGLHRVSLAMNKSTSDQLFSTSPSLQRLRQQIIKLTEVGPSSLGNQAGLGLFATKNIKAGTVVGLYPAHALGYELVVPMPSTNDTSTDAGEEQQEELQDLSMFLAGNDEDNKYFQANPHGNSPYLHATDQPLFQRPSLLSPLFDEEKKEFPPPLYLDVNPNRNDELDGAWTSHYINDGASLLDCKSVEEIDIEQYYIKSTKAKNCIHIPFGPSPILATVTTKKVKKGEELFTSYGVVYWLGAVESFQSKEEANNTPPGMTEKIRAQIVETARDLQAAMKGCAFAYEQEMQDFETLNDIGAES